MRSPVSSYGEGPRLQARRGGHPKSLQRALPVNSSTAAVMASMPVLIVGSGTGAHKEECNEGSAAPVRSHSLMASGLTPPTPNMKIGTFSAVRPYSEKSSPPIEGL